MHRGGEPCRQCQALSESTGLQCRNLAQCRLNNIMFCNVHAARVERFGCDSVTLAPASSLFGFETRYHPYSSATASKYQYPSSTVQREGGPTEVTFSPELMQRLFEPLKEFSVARPVEYEAKKITLGLSPQLETALVDLSDAYRQKILAKTQKKAAKEGAAKEKATREGAVAAEKERPESPVLEQLQRIEQEQREQREQLRRLLLGQQQKGREEESSAAESRLEEEGSLKRKRPEPERRGAERRESEKREERAGKAGPEAKAAPEADVAVLLNDLRYTVRIVYAELATLRALIKTLCGQHIKTEKEVKKVLEPLEKCRLDFDSFISRLASSASGSSLSSSQVTASRKEFQKLTDQFEQKNEEVRAALEKRCKSSKFSFSPSIKFSLDIASGTKKCGGEPIPAALRNWFLSGSSEKQKWENRRLLCNLADESFSGGGGPSSFLPSWLPTGVRAGVEVEGVGKKTVGIGSVEESSSEEESTTTTREEGRALEAFKRQQKLRKGYAVYDVRGNVLAIGQPSEKEEEEETTGPGAGAETGGEGQAEGEEVLVYYLEWLATLEKLVELFGVAGLDATSLVNERMATIIRVGSIVTTLGKETALTYMSEAAFHTFVNAANLAMTYGSYLATPEGVAGAAGMAAFAVHEQFKGKVTESVLKKMVRIAFSRAFLSLLFLSGAGLLGYMAWTTIAATPNTPIPIPPFTASTTPAGSTVQDAILRGGTDINEILQLKNVFNETVEENMRRLAAETRQRTVAFDITFADNEVAQRAAKTNVFFPLLRSPGSHVMTRKQYLEAENASIQSILSPGSDAMVDFFRMAMARSRQPLRRAELRPTPMLGSSPAQKTIPGRFLPRPSVPSSAAPTRPTPILPGSRTTTTRLFPPVSAPPPRSTVPTPMLSPYLFPPTTFALGTGQAATETGRVAQLQTGQAGASAASGLLTIAQLLSQPQTPATAVDFAPEFVEAMRRYRQNTEQATIETDPLGQFQNAEDLNNELIRGLILQQRYFLHSQQPGTTTTRHNPAQAASIRNAIQAAFDVVGEESLFFDPEGQSEQQERIALAPKNRSEAFDHISRFGLRSPAASNLEFLKTIGGATGDSLNGEELARIQARLSLMELGLTGNETAFDALMQTQFDFLRQTASHEALQIGTDIELLAQLVGDVTTQIGSEIQDYVTAAGKKMGKATLQKTAAMAGTIGAIAEQAMGKGKEAALLAFQKMQARDVRDLVLDNSASMQALLNEVLEILMKQELLTLEKLESLQTAIYATLPIDQASAVVSSLLVTIEQQHDLNTDQFDSLLAAQIQRSLGVTSQNAAEIVRAVWNNMPGQAELFSVKQLTQEFYGATKNSVEQFVTKALAAQKDTREAARAYANFVLQNAAVQIDRIVQSMPLQEGRVALQELNAQAKQIYDEFVDIAETLISEAKRQQIRDAVAEQKAAAETKKAAEELRKKSTALIVYAVNKLEQNGIDEAKQKRDAVEGFLRARAKRHELQRLYQRQSTEARKQCALKVFFGEDPPLLSPATEPYRGESAIDYVASRRLEWQRKNQRQAEEAVADRIRELVSIVDQAEQEVSLSADEKEVVAEELEKADEAEAEKDPAVVVEADPISQGWLKKMGIVRSEHESLLDHFKYKACMTKLHRGTSLGAVLDGLITHTVLSKKDLANEENARVCGETLGIDPRVIKRYVEMYGRGSSVPGVGALKKFIWGDTPDAEPQQQKTEPVATEPMQTQTQQQQVQTVPAYSSTATTKTGIKTELN